MAYHIDFTLPTAQARHGGLPRQSIGSESTSMGSVGSIIWPQSTLNMDRSGPKSKFRSDGRGATCKVEAPSPGSINSGEISGPYLLSSPSLHREFADLRALVGPWALKNVLQRISLCAASFQNTLRSSIWFHCSSWQDRLML